MKTVKITAESEDSSVVVHAKLNKAETAGAIYDALGLQAEARTWGDEIYFPIPLDLPLENPREEVDIGALGYWPAGNAFCVFFGRTPASTNERPRPASPVTVFGEVTGDPSDLKKVPSGAEITVDKKD